VPKGCKENKSLRGHESRPHCHDTVLRYTVKLQVCTHLKNKETDLSASTSCAKRSEHHVSGCTTVLNLFKCVTGVAPPGRRYPQRVTNLLATELFFYFSTTCI